MFDPSLQVFPQTSSHPTSLKKRTFAQVQHHKAEVVARDSKDSIVSSIPIVGGSISTISGQQVDSESFLPLDEHPFDHFLVTAELEI